MEASGLLLRPGLERNISDLKSKTGEEHAFVRLRSCISLNNVLGVEKLQERVKLR